MVVLKDLRNRGDFLLMIPITTIGKNCKLSIDFNVMFYYNTIIKLIRGFKMIHKELTIGTKLKDLHGNEFVVSAIDCETDGRPTLWLLEMTKFVKRVRTPIGGYTFREVQDAYWFPNQAVESYAKRTSNDCSQVFVMDMQIL